MPFPDPLNTFMEHSLRAVLRAALGDAVVLPDRVDHLSAFPDVMRERLLDVNLFARLASPDGAQPVPVVLRCVADYVDVLSVEKVTHIDVLFDTVLVLGFNGLGRVAHAVPVRVTDCHHGDVFEILETRHMCPRATTAQADHPDADRLVRPSHA